MRYQQKLKERASLERKRKFQRITKIVLVVLIAGGATGALIWYIATRQPIPEGKIISRSGIHWHAELLISIKGQKQEIPANIGIGAVEQPLHTHDDSGTIHLEFEGFVRKQDITLGRFFKIWGKQFNSNCIFDSCNGPGGSVKILVNGQENKEFENYLLKDKDKIEIRYE